MKKYFLFFFTCISVSTSSFSQTNKTTQLNCGPIPAVCMPGSVNVAGLGPTYFSIGQISNTSTNNSNGGYQNFTCSDSTYLNQGDSYAVQATTGQTYAEVISVFIDFNNDGSFDSTELIFRDPPTVYSHYGIAVIPVAGPLGMPLRLRLGSEVDLYPPADGCSFVQYGQYEDYTVYLNGPTSVQELSGNYSASVFPNPMHSSAKVNICNKDFTQSGRELRIYNSVGELISMKNFIAGAEVVIDRNKMQIGLYFYSLINTDGQKTSGKFVVE